LIDTEGKKVLRRDQIERALCAYLGTVGEVIRQIIRTRIEEVDLQRTGNGHEKDKTYSKDSQNGNSLTDVLLLDFSFSAMDKLMEEALNEVPKAVEEIMLEISNSSSSSDSFSDFDSDCISDPLPSSFLPSPDTLSKSTAGTTTVNEVSYSQWLRAWERHPELNDLMSIRGMAKLYTWMNMIGDKKRR